MRLERIPVKWSVAVVYVAAMFMNILDSTIVNVALPTLAGEFNVATSSIEWVVTGYLLSLAVWIPASGWIGDRLGTKRVFLFALALFTFASALCGVAQSLEQLIAARILQGVGGGILTPVGFAMLLREFPPEERARASKILIIPTAIAPASGPVLGGFLVDSLSWRWVFYVNIPFGIAAFAFGLLTLREHREPRTGGFDVAGFVLSGAGLAATLFALGEGPARGWDAPRVWVPGVVGVAAFALLVYVELRKRYPMLDLRLVSDRLFRQSMATSVFATGGFLGILFVMPLFLQEVRGVSAFQSGLTTFPEAVGVITSSQLAARLYPSVGPRRLMAGGLTVMAALLASLTLVDLETSLWVVRIQMYFIGAAMAFVFIPLQTGAFARITPAQTGQASAIFNAQRQMAAALGVALLATVLSTSLPAGGGSPGEQVDAYHTVFVVATGLSLAGAVMALFIRDADAVATMHGGVRERAPAAAPAD